MNGSKFLKYWLPIVLWMALILVASTDLMSAEHTSRIILPLLRWLDPTISFRTVLRVEFLVRKAAHVLEYAVLAALFYRAWTRTVWLDRPAMSAAAVMVICLLYALSDEFHQSLVPSRTASFRDVVIDVCGAIAGAAAYAMLRPRSDRAEMTLGAG